MSWLLFLISLLGSAPWQEAGRPPKFEPPSAKVGGAQPRPTSALVPGVLPEDATTAARELWKKACEAAHAPGGRPEPVEAFQLKFQIETRRGAQRNETEARFLFLDSQGYVRTSLKSGREHVLGPDGAFLIDGKDVIQLARTRENEADLKQIDETVAIARNFLALTDPSSLRVATLAALETPPRGLPDGLRARANELRWLDVRSPDFLLMRRSEHVVPGDLFRVRLGLAPDTGRVEQAVIGEDSGPTSPTRVLVTLDNVSPLDGYLVPAEISMYELEPGVKEPRFTGKPTIGMWRVSPGTLRPEIGPDDFRP